MPETTYIVSCKDSASDADIAKLKEEVKKNGGQITHEYNLIKGFAVKYPEEQVSTLESHEHVKYVEKDQQMHTMKQ